MRGSDPNDSAAAMDSRAMLGTILLVLLIILLLGAVPAWPHSRSWGYGPTSVLGILLVVVLVLLLLGAV
jgi:hypothetical protein